jgi:hypothetical protein
VKEVASIHENTLLKSGISLAIEIFANSEKSRATNTFKHAASQ